MCPSCGRQVPRNVEVCRCGSERRRLEALGYTFESAPPPPTAARARVSPRPESHGPAAALIGYRVDTDLSAGLRAGLKTFIAALVLTAGGATLRWAYSDPSPRRSNIDVVTSLDRFTHQAGPSSGNTIPAFMTSPGMLGALAVEGTPSDPVRSVNLTELQQGFCSENVARHIRYEYPGYYDGWSDDRLTTAALEKHPEYATRVCSISTRLEAGSAEIIKYTFKPRTILGHALAWLEGLFAAGLVGLACLNLYYRGIVGRG